MAHIKQRDVKQIIGISWDLWPLLKKKMQIGTDIWLGLTTFSNGDNNSDKE